MSRVMQDFTDLLLKQGVISLDQLTEAEGVAKSTGADVGDVLVQMEYATPDEVAQAVAKYHKIPYVDLSKAQIDESVIELVPESVARENNVLPVGEEDGALRILISDPFDIETIEKLRFILNRKIETALAPRGAIWGRLTSITARSKVNRLTRCCRIHRYGDRLYRDRRGRHRGRRRCR